MSSTTDKPDKSASIKDFNGDICEVINGYLSQKEDLKKMKEENAMLKKIIKNNIKLTTDFKYFKNWMRDEIIEEYKLAGVDEKEIMEPSFMYKMTSEILEEFREVEHDHKQIEIIKNKEINKELRMIDEIIKSVE